MPAVAGTVMAAAAKDLTIVRTIDPRHIPEWEAAATAVTDSPEQGHVQTSAHLYTAHPETLSGATELTVRKTALVSLKPDSAVVLVIGDYVVHGPQGYAGTEASQVQLDRIRGRWLLSVTDYTVPSGADGTSWQSADVRAALSAGGAESAALFSLRKATFDKDFEHDLAGTTGAAKARYAGSESRLRKQVSGPETFGLISEVGALGVESVDPGSGTVVLVVDIDIALRKLDSPTDDQSATDLELTMAKVAGKWLIADYAGLDA